MSLLVLSKIQDSKWYISGRTHLYGNKSYETKKFSPQEKTIRKCREINFFRIELPIIQHDKYNIWKHFDRKYVYGQIMEVLLYKDEFKFKKQNIIRRVGCFK